MERTGLQFAVQRIIEATKDDEVGRLGFHELAKPYRELMAYYRCALMEVETKFKVLNEELSLEYDRNPIESIKTRLKSPESIVEKLERLELPLSVESIEENLYDVAGVRVICGFPRDIYDICDAFLNQDDVSLIKMKDYFKEPKDNGYRSVHLIVEIPIFLIDNTKVMPVEVQLRTIGMDWWASLEHKLRYKKDIDNTPKLANELKYFAETAAEMDAQMQRIQLELLFESEKGEDE